MTIKKVKIMAKVKLNYSFNDYDLYEVYHTLSHCRYLSSFEFSLCEAIRASYDRKSYNEWLKENYPDESI